MCSSFLQGSLRRSRDGRLFLYTQFGEVKYSSAKKPDKRESAADAARYDPRNARLVEAAEAHITMPRLEAAMSKIGPIDSNRRPILKELCADALESMWATDALMEDMIAAGDLVTGSRPGCLLWTVLAEKGEALMTERSGPPPPTSS